jgi:hypothetical protein
MAQSSCLCIRSSYRRILSIAPQGPTPLCARAVSLGIGPTRYDTHSAPSVGLSNQINPWDKNSRG